MNSTAFVAAVPLTKSTAQGSSPSRQNLISGKSLSIQAPRRTRSQVQMIAPEVARNAIAVYGIVVAGGGIGAFLRTGSKPSVISGVVAGIILAAAYVKDSLPIALGTAVALTIVFAIRLVKTKKFMPAGMLGLVSLLAAAFFAASIYA